uniref:Uncharacterized protein n=1 Tax=Timema douglasi TaxID=61478 RepID=A0A7R8Z4S4_TIMDO|nr:unnamed protein product [Timema douglasi]
MKASSKTTKTTIRKRKQTLEDSTSEEDDAFSLRSGGDSDISLYNSDKEHIGHVSMTFCQTKAKSPPTPAPNHQASPRSTPNSSPRSTKSPPLPPSSRSAPPTPGGQLQPSNMMSSLGTGADSLAGVGGDVRSAFGSSTGLIGSSSTSLAGSTSNSAVTNSSGRSLRNDLLVAADSVTNAMSTLVRELNSEGSDQEEGEENIRKPLEQPANGSALMRMHEMGSWLQTLFEMHVQSELFGCHDTQDWLNADFEAEDGESDGTGNTAALWREEIRKRYEQESQFIAELRSRNLGNGHDYDDKALRRHASGLPDGDGYKEDDESYVHGPDDDDTGGTNWEEAMKRKVLQNKENGKRPIGGPRTRWMDQAQKDMEAKGAD